MSYQLNIHEKAAIGSLFARHYDRDVLRFPELVKVEEDDTPTKDTQAFNLDFALWFTTKPLKGRDFKSIVSGVLPNNVGPGLHLAVETDSLNLLLVEALCLPAAPLNSYGPYITQVQPWLHRCLSNAAGPETRAALEAHAVSDATWENLERCVSDFSKFDMLRLMIVGDRMCFFGQMGERTSVRTTMDVKTFCEQGRQVSIRVAKGRALAIDGFSTVSVARTDDATAWIRE
jgi:hypothetical protein